MRSQVSLVEPTSLAMTVDRINEAFFFNRAVSRAERSRALTWISAQFGEPGGYAGTFAERETERALVARAFTGENLGRNASRRHILAEEACRAVRLVAGPGNPVAPAGAAAEALLQAAFDRVRSTPWKTPRGTFCCAPCTVGVWRNVAAGGVPGFADQVPNGIKHLRKFRDGNGGWRRFPFYYTVSALIELPFKEARHELGYARSRCERLLKRMRGASSCASRRRAVLERALEIASRR